MIICLDDVFYIGVMCYIEGVEFIFVMVISINDVEFLSCLLCKEKVWVFMCFDCVFILFVIFYNVIGEIEGSEFFDEIIFIGGYFDFWDVGEGVYDDGAGCVYVMEVIELFWKINY